MPLLLLQPVCFRTCSRDTLLLPLLVMVFYVWLQKGEGRGGGGLRFFLSLRRCTVSCAFFSFRTAVLRHDPNTPAEVLLLLLCSIL